jgi:hypothetical protein
MEDLVEYPYFAQLEENAESSRVFKILLGSLGMIFLAAGAVVVVIGLTEGLEALPAGIAVLAVGGLCLFASTRAAATERSVNLKIAARTEEYLAAERKRLTGLKKSMSVAEWETYKLQLQNQQLLRDIKNKPVTTRTSTTTRAAVWFEEERD